MILSILLAVSAVPSQTTETVTVDVPAEARVSGIEFSLGDIARIDGTDQASVARVAGLHLGYAPAPGYSRLLEVAALEREASTSFPGIEINFVGGNACRVLAQVQTIEAAAIGSVAKAELTSVFGSLDADLRMHGQLKDLSVPQGESNALLQARLRENTPRPGAWSVPVDVLVDGSVVRTIWTSWQVDVWEDREVLVRDVRRGGVLSSKDVERRRVRVGGQVAGASADKAALRGATARRDMRAGEIVRMADIDREIVIRRGDLVHVEVTKGAITARGAAVAQEDGRVGDTIRVLMSSTRAEVIAVAAGKERVEIRMN